MLILGIQTRTKDGLMFIMLRKGIPTDKNLFMKKIMIQVNLRTLVEEEEILMIIQVSL